MADTIKLSDYVIQFVADMADADAYQAAVQIRCTIASCTIVGQSIFMDGGVAFFDPPPMSRNLQ